MTLIRLGDAATGIALDSQRSQLTNLLRPYLDTQLRMLQRESRSLSDQVLAAQDAFSQMDNGAVCNILVSALTMRRNKRVMLAYHLQRIDILKDLFWSVGGQVGAILGQDREERKNMSPSEVDFLRDYARLHTDYRNWILDQGPVDILGSLDAKPPKELYVQVRPRLRSSSSLNLGLNLGLHRFAS